MSELEKFALWGALPRELRLFIMLFVDFDTQETCIITNRETRLLAIAVRKLRKEIIVKQIFNNRKIERQAASVVFRDLPIVSKSCSAVIRLEQISY
ncbi:hypothetical protein KIN20_036432 [Parelaphostrongylus tenuis]|uniref:F-box domain-containing protein n=1 Tax=Parelaphostrongylus tenuis TaxID=148309 RepID=A0AAD5RCT6_PARTN|nr:hypothetical protein KIN20_036432 [Parelaphostrongylus tenuis]